MPHYPTGGFGEKGERNSTRLVTRFTRHNIGTDVKEDRGRGLMIGGSDFQHKGKGKRKESDCKAPGGTTRVGRWGPDCKKVHHNTGKACTGRGRETHSPGNVGKRQRENGPKRHVEKT